MGFGNDDWFGCKFVSSLFKMKSKDKQIREIQRESDKWYDKYVTWCIISFVFILGFMVLLLYFLPLNKNYKDLNQQLESCQEKVPVELNYRYNHTKCVFDYGDEVVVCSLLMRESCSEIRYIDKNCEVIE